MPDNNVIVLLSSEKACSGLRQAAERNSWMALLPSTPTHWMRQIFHLDPEVVVLEISPVGATGPRMVQLLGQASLPIRVVTVLGHAEPQMQDDLERQLRVAGACCCLTDNPPADEVERLVLSLRGPKRRTSPLRTDAMWCRPMLN